MCHTTQVSVPARLEGPDLAITAGHLTVVPVRTSPEPSTCNVPLLEACHCLTDDLMWCVSHPLAAAALLAIAQCGVVPRGPKQTNRTLSARGQEPPAGEQVAIEYRVDVAGEADVRTDRPLWLAARPVHDGAGADLWVVGESAEHALRDCIVPVAVWMFVAAVSCQADIC